VLDIAKDMQSLTHFKRNTAKVMKRLKESGKPVVLTGNGHGEIVVQDAVAYERLPGNVGRKGGDAGVPARGRSGRQRRSDRAGAGVPPGASGTKRGPPCSGSTIVIACEDKRSDSAVAAHTLPNTLSLWPS
jgi:prevent-host-death family protein